MTTEQKYKAIKKRLGLSDKDIARMFGYENTMSFYNSKGGRDRTVQGVVEFYEHIAKFFIIE